VRVRIKFTKGGALRFAGHLDLHKLWERVARRAQLPLAYSQGFHPQPKISLASALPLGFLSRAEVVELLLSHDVPLDGIGPQLSAALPAGMEILEVEAVRESLPSLQSLLRAAEFEVRLRDPIPWPVLQERVESVLKAGNIMRERRGKAYDLRLLILELRSGPFAPGSTPDGTDRGAADLVMRLAARDGSTARPEEVLDELGIDARDVTIERTALEFAHAES